MPVLADGPLVNARYYGTGNYSTVLQYLDHTTGILIHTHVVDSLTVWEELVGNKPCPPRKAMFSGPCTVDHQDGFYFKAYVEDNGEQGKADFFSIQVFDANGLVYEAGNTKIKGNIQIHKP